MEEKAKKKTNKFLKQSGIKPFKERLPWLGGDLQTLRDTFIEEKLPNDNGTKIYIPIPSLNTGYCQKGILVGLLDLPRNKDTLNGLVLMLHGLGGSSQRQGLRRMGDVVLNANFAVLRLNLRGAGIGRSYAPGTYCASCNNDVIPAIIYARKICDLLKSNYNYKGKIPLYGVGISLGGTILLNACLERNPTKTEEQLLDGLVCTSSPLDLDECSRSIERPRNKIYQNWIVNRLINQTLEDPFISCQMDRNKVKNDLYIRGKNPSIRLFDKLITAPRWGYSTVEEYYKNSSPIEKIIKNNNSLPPTLMLQAEDDPWVPIDALVKLEELINNKSESKLTIIRTKKGGHNGFHSLDGCWGDKLVKYWLLSNQKSSKN